MKGIKINKEIGNKAAIKSDIPDTLKFSDQIWKFNLFDTPATSQKVIISSYLRAPSDNSAVKEAKFSLPGTRKLKIKSKRIST